MSMMSEFKEFALKGNVMDLAVGVIIGGAFGKIVDSFVGDLIMPIVGKIFGGTNFTEMYVMLAPPVIQRRATAWHWRVRPTSRSRPIAPVWFASISTPLLCPQA